MKQFLLNWNYKKQFITEVLGYGCIALVGNSLLGKKEDPEANTKNPVKLVQQMPKMQKVFNGVLLGTMAVDMTASFLMLKWLKKKYL